MFGLGTRPVLITSGMPQGTHLGPVYLDTRAPAGCKAPATYMGVLNSKGECKIGFGDMGAHLAITPDLVLQNRAAIEAAPLIVLDGNIPQKTMDCVLQLAEELDTPVFFEPTDTRKASKPFLRNPSRVLSFASPNLNELTAMASHLGYTNNHADLNIDAVLQISSFLMSHIDNLMITMGEKGVLILRKQNEDLKFFREYSNRIMYKKPIRANVLEGRLYPVMKLGDVCSVSGAGDCLAGGFIVAMLKGMDEGVCMSVAFEAAKMALFSPDAVPERLFDLSHPSWNSKAVCVTVL